MMPPSLRFGYTCYLSAEHSRQYQALAPQSNPRAATQEQREYLAGLLDKRGQRRAARSVRQNWVTGVTMTDGRELIIAHHPKDNDYQSFLDIWTGLHPKKGRAPLSYKPAEHEIDQGAAARHLQNVVAAKRTLAVI